ncbi:MAG: phage tail protein [Gammaproteobacteria bacterium]|nr:MAG: phage tail protein [Gammaproteobacteria bacterium]
MQAAGQALAQANSLLTSGVLGADAAAAARGLNSIASSIRLMTTLGNRILLGVTGISGGDPSSAINGVGGSINNAVLTTGGIFDSVQLAFNAAFNPGSPSLENIELTALSPSDLLSGFRGGLPDAGASHAHLLVLTSQTGESYYFNLSTAGYDTLRRQTHYNVAAQSRLTRSDALQAVSRGGETITISGAIFTKKSGAGQLDRLRGIGYAMTPLNLTTGYGETLGQWYLTRIEEEQSGLFADGMPRKQQFTLEFQRYGEDYQNI